MRAPPVPLAAAAALLLALASSITGAAKLQKPSLWPPDIATWEPPANMSRECPYYHAGYDFEGRPVMVIELGKWKTEKYAKIGPAASRALDRHGEKFVWRTGQLKPVDPHAEHGVVIIMDLTGFNHNNLRDPSSLSFLLKFGRVFARIDEQVVSLIGINASAAANIFANILRNIFRNLGDRLEVHSTRRERWTPLLLTRIPKDQLPPEYGGSRGFKPVKFYG